MKDEERDRQLLAEAERIDREELEGEGEWRFVRRVVPPTDPSMIYSLRLPIGAVAALRMIADDRGTQPTRLIRDWVLEHIESERAGSARVSESAPAYSVTPQPHRSSSEEVAVRLAKLGSAFAACVKNYDEIPFSQSGQFEWHDKTIHLRRRLRTPSKALANEEFLASLRTTLRRWGLGVRASVLVDEATFAKGLRAQSDELDRLAKLRLDDPTLPLHETIERLWSLVETLPIVENKSKVVAATKTLHHLLPDLVPPMDIAWTGRFFRWYPAYFSGRQRKIFEQGMVAFAELARRCDPQSYVNKAPWNTSLTKVLDNAIIGFCKLHKIPPLM